MGDKLGFSRRIFETRELLPATLQLKSLPKVLMKDNSSTREVRKRMRAQG